MATKSSQGKTKQVDSRPQTQPVPAAKSTTVSKGKDKMTAKQKSAAALAAELKLVRATIKEAVKQLSLRIDSGIVGALRVLEKKNKPDEPCNLPGAKSTAQMAKKLRALKLKPVKGRLKDITQIDTMVKKITGKMAKTS